MQPIKKHISEIPVSLRTASSELRYQHYKATGRLVDLQDEDTVIEFKYFKIIDNRFPYDMAYAVCHMLIPKRRVSDYTQLRWRERRELKQILYGEIIQGGYSQIVENTAPTRSISAVWHLHLLKFYDNRSKFSK